MGSALAVAIPADTTRVRVSTQFDKANTTLANITGLSVAVATGLSYSFSAVLHTHDAGATGGFKFAMGGTATATAIICEVTLQPVDDLGVGVAERLTALGSAKAWSGGATDVFATMRGLITVNAAGTLTVQFAQETASGTSSVLVGSTFTVEQVA